MRNPISFVPQRTLTALVHRAADINVPVARAAVARLRTQHPGDTPGQVLDALSRRYLGVVTGIGAAAGGTAAVPGVGTIASIAVTGAEVAAFVEATAVYTLAAAEVHGVQLEDVEQRRALVFAVLLGESGAVLMEKTAARSDAAWGQLLPRGVPRVAVEQANKVMNRWLLRRFGARQGAAALGRLAPFGIGAAIGGAANVALGRGVVAQVRRAFGNPPEQFGRPAELTAGPAR